MVGLDQKLTIDNIQRRIGIVGDFTDDWRKGLVGFRQITERKRITVFALAALGNVKQRVTTVISHAHILKTLWIGFVFIDKLVLRLGRANFVIPDGLKLVFG